MRQAPLLPKLRGHFAEFLNNTSSAGLGILSPSTCVGLRYGLAQRHSGFSRQPLRRLRYYASLHFASSRCMAAFPAMPVSRLSRYMLSRARLRFCVPAVLAVQGAGILTCCPSATPPGLALGPDSPRADQLYPGILGYSAIRILTLFSLLIPAFSLPAPPPSLAGTASAVAGMLLYQPLLRLPGFGGVFQPRTFSAQSLSTSELLRTL